MNVPFQPVQPVCLTSTVAGDLLSLEETISRVRAAFLAAEAAVGSATGALKFKVDAPIPGTRKQRLLQNLRRDADGFTG